MMRRDLHPEVADDALLPVWHEASRVLRYVLHRTGMP